MEKINYKNQGSRVKGGKLSSYSGSPPILGGDEGVVIRRSTPPSPFSTSTPPSPLFSKEGVPKAGAFDKEGKLQGSGIVKRFLLSLAAVLCLTAAPAHALDISDYTAYPPFLPRVTSPNILFMLDYSKSMVRPAYGTCKTIADSSDAAVADSDSTDQNISDCRNSFSYVTDDYSPTTAYSGYFDNGSVKDVAKASSCDPSSTSYSYSDTTCAYKYKRTGTQFEKDDTTGTFNGNWLNWLTATQFDIVKKVVVGGDVHPAPEQSDPGELRSQLIDMSVNPADTASDYDGKFRKQMALPNAGNSSSCTTANSPECTQSQPEATSSNSSWPSVTYGWVDTSAGTTVFGTADADDAQSPAQPLPFPFTFYGNTYTQFYVDTNGFISFDPKTIVFQDSVEKGAGSWAATGLWHRETSGTCQKANSGTGSWYYGRLDPVGGDCDFDTGLNSGTLTSDTIAVPAGGAATLRFSFWYETEGGITWDKKIVEISQDGGAWTQLAQLSGDAMNQWITREIDISASAGHNIQIRFSFNTGDAIGNNMDGWYIDDIMILSTNTSTSYTYPLNYFNSSIPNTNSPNNIIAPYWDDFLICDTSTGGSCTTNVGSTIKTLSTGTAPNRVFVITYDKMVHIDDTGRADTFTFQILLYEGSNHIVFQYKEVRETKDFGEGRSATIGVENSSGSGAKQYSYCTACGVDDNVVSNSQAIFATPHITYVVQPVDGTHDTSFYPALPLTSSYTVNIKLATGTSSISGYNKYRNVTKNKYYDHVTEGLLQDLRDGELGGTLGFRLAIMQLNATDGGNVSKHFNQKDGMGSGAGGWPSLMNDTRKADPVTNTPLAESLYEATRYFQQVAPAWSGDYTNDSGGAAGNQCGSSTNYDPYCFKSAQTEVSCCRSFVLIISSGNYMNDNQTNIFSETDTNGTIDAAGYKAIDGSNEGTVANGGWLDNVAYKSHTTDWRSDLEATQNLTIYAVNTFGAGSGDGTNVLKRAAKYGGFDDADGDNTYDFSDTNGNGRCDTGESWEDDKDCDGDPDTYFAASGGSDLKDTIIDAVTEIMKSSASGTSVSVLSTSAGGEGAIYQAYFYPARLEGETDERTWPGFMKSFFLDKKQNLRDDSSSGTYTCSGDACTYSGTPNAALSATGDKIAQMCLNTTTNEVKVKLYADSNGDYATDTTNDGSCPGVGVAADSSTVVGMDDVVSIWEAGKKLALRDKSTRNIYTWVPTTVTATNNEGFSSLSGTPMDFIYGTDGNQTVLSPYLRAQAGDVDGAGTTYSAFTADKEAEYIIRFIRGEAITPGTTSADGTGVSYRNRCVSIVSSTGSDESGCEDTSSDKQRVWTLGDIINSTPTLVSGPGEQYDLLYKDSDYLKFRTKYQNRRRMVYVGANDGMLHAFNAGIFNESTTSFSDNPSVNGWGASTKLGDELWAFVPYDNLPHLQWLACNGTESDPSQCGSSEYTHVYYVDARPKVSDVRIFSNTHSESCSGNGPAGGISGQTDACHPGGWGTIMIMSMRLGGGAIDVTIGGTNREFRSAYYAFDVTDPEKPPKLLWRFYDSTLGFTTSYPAIARICYDSANPDNPPKLCNSPAVEKWYMVVGSGPNNNTGPQASSIRDYGGNSTTLAGKVFVVDLADGNPDKTFTLESSNAYMGDPLVVDENFDFTADAIYIGSSIGAGSEDVNGKVYRIKTNGKIAGSDGSVTACPSDTSDTADWCRSVLIDAGKPVLTAPSVATDSQRNLWVFFGTGRLRNSGDPSDLTNSEPQTFYGIKDACGKKAILTTTPKTGICSNDYTTSQLADTSGSAVTLSTQKFSGVNLPSGVTFGSDDYSSLLTTMRSTSVKGWYYNLNDPSTASERVLSRAAILGGVVLFTTYTPAASICSIFGDSRLYALNYETGTAYNKAIIGTSDTGVSTTTSSTGTKVSKALELGKGMPTAVGIAVGEKVTGFVQKSTGEIIRIEAEPGTSVKSGAASWREKTGGGGTSEIETIYKHIVK